MVKIIRDNVGNRSTEKPIKFGCKECGLIYTDIANVQKTIFNNPITHTKRIKYIFAGRCPDCFNVDRIKKFK